jgi:hypothetical protein
MNPDQLPQAHKDMALFAEVAERHKASHLELQIHRYENVCPMYIVSKYCTTKKTHVACCIEHFRTYPIGKFRCAKCGEIHPLSASRRAYVLPDDLSGFVCGACNEEHLHYLTVKVELYALPVEGLVLYDSLYNLLWRLQATSLRTLDESMVLAVCHLAIITIQAAVRGFLIRRRVRKAKPGSVCA